MLKKNLDFLARAKKKTQDTTISVSPDDEIADFEQLDKQAIQQLKETKFPTWQQLRHVGKYLNKSEKKIIKISSLAIGFAIILLLITFYWTHTILIPTNGGDYTED